MSWVKASKIQHPDDVREALGFTGEPKGFDLLDHYDRAILMGEPYSRGDIRVAWKLANDPYYWEAFKRYQSLQTIVKAGFFDDGQDPGVVKERGNIQLLTTPLEAIRKKIMELEELGTIHDKPLIAMLTTGCFAPVQDGHIAMMDVGKEELQKQGYEVVGGFMSPSHDNYVSTKDDDARRLTASHRSVILSRMLESRDWLEVDPWESRYAPTDINFTDTIQRLENYINAHINTVVPIKIAYTFGSDNIQFARTFINKGLAVCVPRPGHDKGLEEFIEKSGLKENPHVIITKSSNHEISSTLIRNGEAPSPDELEKDDNYKALLKGEARKTSENDETKIYLVRDDLSWATQDWQDKVNTEVLEKALDLFRQGFVRAIENAFERSRAHGYPKNVEVVQLSVEDQIEQAREITEAAPEWVLNNDSITGGNHTPIGLSRLFSLSSPQIKANGLIPRPNCEDIKRILGRLKKGEYTIVDDDIASGYTLKVIEDQLPDGVTFKEKIALSETAFKNSYPDREYAFWDIVDARDFLMGAKEGGLVVQLFNGETGRAPYMLPYTSLVNRAKIPPDQEMAFTEEILNLNKRFFRDVWSDIHLEDTDPQFQSFMNSIGFRGKTHLGDLCTWHQKHICK